MTPPWMIRVVAMTLFVGAGAWCVERALRHRHWPARWVWMCAIAAVISLTVLTRVTPAMPLDIVPGAVFGAVLENVRVEAPSWVAAQSTASQRVLPWVWVAGSVIALLAYAVSLNRVRRLRRHCRPGLLCGRPVLISPVAGPAAIGLLRPAIIVPEWLLEASERSRRLVLLHEAEHVRARDPWLLALSPLAAIAMPWNLPLWMMVRSLRQSIELDCDRRVLARGVPAETYGRVLIDVAGQRGPALSPALAAPRSRLARRLVGLTLQGSAPRAALWATAAMLSLVLAVEALPASTQVRGTDPHERVGLAHRSALALAGLDAGADYLIDGEPATYQRVRDLDPVEIRSVQVESRRTVSGDASHDTSRNTVRVTTRNAAGPLRPRTGVAFEGIGGPDPRIRLGEDITFAARDVRLLVNGREIEAERLGSVDPASIHGVKVIRLSTSARPEVHFTTRQRI